MGQLTNIELHVNNNILSPVGWDLIGIDSDATLDFSGLTLNVSSLDFEGDDKAFLQQILDDKGLEAAIPCLVVVPSDNALVSPIQEDFILTVVSSLEIADTFIRFGIERRYGLDRFMERANKTTWDIINNKTAIVGAVKFPYRVVSVDIKADLAALEIQLGVSLIALYDVIAGVANATAALLGGITGSLESIAQLISQAARLVLLIFVIVKTTKRIFEIYFPPKKYFWENKAYNLIRLGCEYLGYTLSSSLLSQYTNLGIIGAPSLDTNKSLLDNLTNDTSYYNGKFPTSQDSVATFGALFSEMKKMLNATVKIIGTTVHFERESFYQNNPATNITTTLTDQEGLQNVRRYNNDEAWYHKILSGSTDVSDRYTMNDIKGLKAEYQTEYTGTADPDLVNIEGSETINISFAYMKRKDKLSYFDQQAYIFGASIDAVTGTLGSGTNFASSVASSIGEGVISAQNFNKTKMVWSIGGKQTYDYLDHIGMNAIYQDCHTNLQVKENYQELKDMTVPFSVENFRQLVGKHYVLDSNNELIKILRYSWLPWDAQIKLETAIFVPEKSKTKTVKLHG